MAGRILQTTSLTSDAKRVRHLVAYVEQEITDVFNDFNPAAREFV
jgi:hypothetical protein